ncbi:MAG: hypothetical protein COZ06_27855 [Armatimonadetes bacterium CG_4_10_14_3_um_filter_66_18]|nr:hypothetical protein [Armatimonadota bacterium]OIO96503.1 MAG: hypothetical protein AUJ96_24655 [Armatimonadetes bacterium CG2_30_66_41]PIU94085.1 MAG: hypothetical protein COS65_09395 [Armatimonadetes bacterium CG06_land_8_20_14_3_00_66_21]PIW15708.1 MAG: hypothetical protein COW34_06540 [Armatimonadetes bacterium CG17_big_fil_post_rev_8_21_14_2_50_66_6]PIX46265.1 MAG: hypothetical protein COZ57_13010 [Armatimonadetes bacterium CG_4_8_14_3_um_filter_66_20]PIY40610.1 MAG: hypothetical prote
MRLRFATALLLSVHCAITLRPVQAETAPALANELNKAGFEDAKDAALTGWSKYGSGHELDRAVVHIGTQSIRCTASGEGDGMGVVQVIRYDKPDKRPIILGGWSKAENIGAGGNYCVYLDIHYDDGKPWWGKVSDWRRGTHDWEYAAQVYLPEKPVKEIEAFVFLRRTTGTAWFDDVFVSRGGLHFTGVGVAFDYPRTPNSLRVSAGLTDDAKWRCSLLSATGAVLDSATGTGKTLSWFWQGRKGARPELARLTAEGVDGQQAALEMRVTRLPTTPNPVRAGYAVWTRNSMQKVYPTEFSGAADKSEAELSLARNEHEGVQFAVTPADSVTLEGVRLQVGDFTSEKGDAFPAGGLRRHVVGYVWVETPAAHPAAPAVPNWRPSQRTTRCGCAAPNCATTLLTSTRTSPLAWTTTLRSCASTVSRSWHTSTGSTNARRRTTTSSKASASSSRNATPRSAPSPPPATCITSARTRLRAIRTGWTGTAR